MLSLLVALVVASSSSVLAAPGLSLTISGDLLVTDVDNFKVVATLHNTGDETMKVLNSPNSVLTPKLPTEVFNVVGEKGSAAFTGARVKYSPTLGAHHNLYITLAPGQSIDFTHPLGSAYDFTPSGTGAYTITPSALGNTLYYVANDGSIKSITVDTVQPHVATLAGKLVSTVASVSPQPRPIRAKRVNTFVNCDATQQGQISTAVTNAQSLASDAAGYLALTFSGTERYITWFGDVNYVPVVQSHFDSIANGQLFTDTFDCGCPATNEPDVFAYVYPDQPGTIYLCNAFWNAKPLGSDSQAGTLVHESSHFNINGGTQDYVYGKPSAQQLAKDHPDQAAMNADNHEYFAENSPFLA